MGIYLPSHKKNYTNTFYMKDIIAGKKPYYKVADIIPCCIPRFTECRPENVIDELNLRDNEKVMAIFPELADHKGPADRDFFFNVIITIFPHKMEKMKYAATMQRKKGKNIKNEIEVA